MVARIGILTGGGDCPGLNAAIRAIVRRADQHNIQVYGFHNGWKGVLDQNAEQLTIASTRGLLHRGGTILGTSRVDPYREPDGPARIREALMAAAPCPAMIGVFPKYFSASTVRL